MQLGPSGHNQHLQLGVKSCLKGANLMYQYQCNRLIQLPIECNYIIVMASDSWPVDDETLYNY